jgi:rhomboid family GlyGly-CTERM serine protease
VWWLFGLLSGVSVLLQWWGERAQHLLRYERAAVMHGEYWRLVTAHWVHGSFEHLWLNLAGVLLIVLLFAKTYSAGQWLTVLLLSTGAIAFGFVFYEPQLEWYVGLSGVLHGALAAGCVAWWRQQARPLALALTLILVGKLLWEQLHGALPLSGSMTVIVDAHLYGAAGGVLAGILLQLFDYRWWRGS